MKISYTINKDDLLIGQLYLASKSKHIQRKRQRSRTLFPISYLLVSLGALMNTETILSIVPFVLAILWFILYPIWEKHHYIKHYKARIDEQISEIHSELITLELADDYILVKDGGTELKALTTELEEITEISRLIIVRLKGGNSFVLPNDKITSIDSVKNRLKSIAKSSDVDYTVEEDWKWK